MEIREPGGGVLSAPRPPPFDRRGPTGGSALRRRMRPAWPGQSEPGSAAAAPRFAHRARASGRRHEGRRHSQGSEGSVTSDWTALQVRTSPKFRIPPDFVARLGPAGGAQHTCSRLSEGPFRRAGCSLLAMIASSLLCDADGAAPGRCAQPQAAAAVRIHDTKTSLLKCWPACLSAARRAGGNLTQQQPAVGTGIERGLFFFNRCGSWPAHLGDSGTSRPVS